MSLTAERLYIDLGRLIAEMPELGAGTITPEIDRWMSAATALVKSSGCLSEAIQLKVACENLDSLLRPRNAETIKNILHRVLASVELNVPPEVRRSVICVGEDFDAYMAVRQLLRMATADALLVEPEAAGKVLADYAILAPERVTVRLLADQAQYQPSLVAGVERWAQRFGGDRTLRIRLAPPNSLHERLILLDSERAWVLGVPFSKLAKRRYTALVRMSPEDEARKVAVYAEIWEEAEPLSPHS
jgi:hypothetical protein